MQPDERLAVVAARELGDMQPQGIGLRELRCCGAGRTTRSRYRSNALGRHTYGRGKSREAMLNVSNKLANSRRRAMQTGFGKLEAFTPQERADLAE